MPQKERALGKIAATGIISLVVGVASGLLLDYFRSKQPNLEYTTITTSVFSGPSENLAIVTIDIENTGKKELEDLVSRIQWTGAELRESKVTGLPPEKIKERKEPGSLTISSDYLNPEEKLRLDLLLTLTESALRDPEIEVRAKGLVGKEKKREESRKKSALPATVLSVLVALLTAFGLLPEVFKRFRGKRRNSEYTTSHRDDQRDVTAYILDVHGLHAEASALRHAQREMSYWSITDELTQKMLDGGDESKMRNLAESFEHLMDYAAIAETSCFLVNYNLARIHLRLGDAEKATSKLKEAYKENHEVIAKRIRLVPELKALYDPKSEKVEG